LGAFKNPGDKADSKTVEGFDSRNDTMRKAGGQEGTEIDKARSLSSMANPPVESLQPGFSLLPSCIPYSLFLCPPVSDTTKSTGLQDAIRKSEWK
jgi:hypothetical protein